MAESTPEDELKIAEREVKIAARVAAKLAGESILTSKQLDVAVAHYLIAAIWADCNEGTHPRPTKESAFHARAAIVKFSTLIGPKLQQEILDAHGYGSHADCGNIELACAAMGHDIWLTRQGHGVGFRDREELPHELREACYCACKELGEATHSQYRGWMEITD